MYQQQQITGTQYVPVRTNHALHFVLSIITFGFWIPVWIIMAIINANRVKAMRTNTQVVTSTPAIQCQMDPRPEAYRDGYQWCVSHGNWHNVSPVRAA